MVASTRELIFMWMQMSILITLTFLAVDVVLVIKNPFYPKNWRIIRVYAPVSIVVGAVYGIFMSRIYHVSSKEDTQFYPRVRFNSNLVLKSIYIVVSVSCNAYSFYRLTRPGISKKMRFKYFLQQVRYSLVGILLGVIYCGYDYYVLITGNKNIDIN